jgi:hypothetical protein
VAVGYEVFLKDTAVCSFFSFLNFFFKFIEYFLFRYSKKNNPLDPLYSIPSVASPPPATWAEKDAKA